MAESGSPLSKPILKWQVALAIGLPVAVGFGYWYLKSKNRKEGIPNLDEKDKSKSREISIDGDISSKHTEKLAEKTPLEIATSLKEEGNKWFKSGKYNEAIARYEKAIEACPLKETVSLATFYQNKAAAHEQLQQYEEVKAACAKALDLNPKYTKALLRRAKACEHTNDLSQALEDIISACLLENFQSQSTLLSADRILHELGRQHAKEAMATKIPIMPSDSFIKSYFMSFANDPLNAFLSGTEGDNSWGYLKAVECFKRNKFNCIIPACTEEINSTEGLYKNEAILLRATFYHLMGQNSLALPDLEIIINNEDINPRLRANALIKRAVIHKLLEGPQSSTNDINRAVTIDPENSDIYHHRGQVNLLLEKFKEAADDFKLSVTLNPKNPITAVQKCLSEYRLALLAKDVDRVNELMKQFEEIIREYPECIECYILYAQVLIDQQEFQKADEIFQKAIKVDPKNAVLLVQRAVFVLQWTGDVDTAVKYINEALFFDDKCEHAYETLGTIEVQRGDLAKAIELFDKALPLTKSELEMTHIFSLKHAAIAQKTVTEKMNIRLPRNLFNS